MTTGESFVVSEDGVRLFVQAVGTGPQTVVVPDAMHLAADFAPFLEGRRLVFYHPRNRGRSDAVHDRTKLERGIHHDVEDLDAVRRHLGAERVDVIGHSAFGLMAALYAMRFPAHVTRVVQIGPPPPDAAKSYPAHLTGADATFGEVSAKLAQLQRDRSRIDPKEFRRQWWSLLRVLAVADPATADQVNWGREEDTGDALARGLQHWTEHVYPSIQRLALTREALASVTCPVLTIHGTRDRQAPYGGGREWALLLPNARLVTVENAAHLPWIEAPGLVFGAIQTFLGVRRQASATWPADARRVRSIDPNDAAAP